MICSSGLCHVSEDGKCFLKCWYLPTSLCSVTTKNIVILTAVRTENLASDTTLELK